MTSVTHHHSPNNWDNRNFFQPLYVVQEPQPSYIVTVPDTTPKTTTLSDKQFKTIAIGLLSLAVIIIAIVVITR